MSPRAKERVPSELKALAQMCDNLGNLEQEIGELEDLLAEKKAELKELSDETIPTYMSELGWSEGKLADGRKVSIQSVVRAHISRERRDAAHAWLRKHGAAELIKNELKIMFGKGEEGIAEDWFTEAEAEGYRAGLRPHVHPQTLNKFVRERMARAEEIDRELLGVYVGSTTKITEPK